MKAVIPAAGLGTRFLPATKNSPKEMLPLLDKPAIQYVVEEAVDSGVTEILIVTGRGKRAIEDHFDRSLELESILERKGESKMLDEMRRIADMADIYYVRQKEPLGLGHAVLCAKSFVRDEPFAVLLGDDIVVSPTPCTRQLIDLHEQMDRSSIIAVERVPPERIENYGVVKPGASVSKSVHAIAGLVEKPRRQEAPSDLGILGRYVLTPEIFKVLETIGPGAKGEIQLTDGLATLLRTQRMFAFEFTGKRYDLGDKLEWLKTNIELGLMHPYYRDELRRFMEARVR